MVINVIWQDKHVHGYTTYLSVSQALWRTQTRGHFGATARILPCCHSSPSSRLSSIHYPSAVLLPSSSPWIDVFLMVDSADGWMGAEAHCWLRRKVHCGQLNPHVSGSCRVAINNRRWGQIIHNFCPWPQPLHLLLPSSKSRCTLVIITRKDRERDR